MITEISKQLMREIVDNVTEEILLKIPDIIGTLMTNHVVLNKANKEFYKKYSEFRDHKNTVASVIEQVEGDNPHMDYQKLLDKAVPHIQDRIKSTLNLDTLNVSIPSMEFNGEL